MTPKQARILTRLYPRAWRERYAEEFAALLETQPATPLSILNTLFAALREHLLPTQGKEAQLAYTFGQVIVQPTAVIPMAMSFLALCIVLLPIIVYGISRGGDEGTAAHLWQITMVAQLAVIIRFALKWLPRAPRQTIKILALQLAANLPTLAAVFFLT